MNWNRDEVRRLLSANIIDQPLDDGGHVWIHETGVFLAADPERPVQGLPFFEISLACTTLAPVPRSGMPTGLGMYFEPVSSSTLRFSITRREDGSVSLSGVWEGLNDPHNSDEAVA
jgi:hypothetical protein